MWLHTVVNRVTKVKNALFHDLCPVVGIDVMWLRFAVIAASLALGDSGRSSSLSVCSKLGGGGQWCSGIGKVGAATNPDPPRAAPLLKSHLRLRGGGRKGGGGQGQKSEEGQHAQGFQSLLKDLEGAHKTPHAAHSNSGAPMHTLTHSSTRVETRNSKTCRGTAR